MNIYERLRRSQHKNNNQMEKEMTVAELVNKINQTIVGKKIDRNVINRIENGSQDPSISLLVAYSKVFNVSTDYMLGNIAPKSDEENIKSIADFLGLSDFSIKEIQKFSFEDKTVLNAFIEENSVELLKFSIENYYNQTYQIIQITGLGAQETLSSDESKKIFKYLSNEFLFDIFNVLIHNPNITNIFMRNATNNYYDNLKDATIEASSQYEQTPKRQEFISNLSNEIEKLKSQNNNFDYYKSLKKPPKKGSD